MAHGDNLVARLQKATQSPSATLLLMRLLYWHKNGKGRHLYGQKWVPNSLADWSKETGLTKDQVRTAFKVFGEAHLVETKVLIYGTRKTLHARPTQRAEAISEGTWEEGEDLLRGDQPHGTVGSVPQYQGLGPTVPGSGAHSHIHGDSQGEIKEGGNGEPYSSQALAALPEKVSEEGEHMKMSEALKAGKEKTSKLIHKPDSVSALEHVWKAKVSEITGAMVGLKEKERGQLKHFIAVCPKGEAEGVLKEVLEDWISFTAQVKSQAGVKISPAYPNAGFLLQHAAIAVIFAKMSHSIAAGKTKPKAQKAPQVQDFPNLKIVQSIAYNEESPATYEELVALSKGL